MCTLLSIRDSSKQVHSRQGESSEYYSNAKGTAFAQRGVGKTCRPDGTHAQVYLKVKPVVAIIQEGFI